MKTSAARRLNDVFHKAVSFHDDRRPGTFQAWTQIFGVSDGSQTAEAEDAVTSLLHDVRADITEFEAGLRGTEAESLAAEIVSQARLFTSPAQLSTDWRTHKSNYLAPQTLKAWQWAALYFPSEEDNVDGEALEGLRELLNELQTAAQDPELPNTLRRFVLRQVTTLRRAIARYAVKGIQPLRDAAVQTAGEAQRDQHELEDAVNRSGEKGFSLAGKLLKVFRKTAEVAGDADKLAKGGAAIAQLCEKARPLVEQIVDAATK
jgi:hypothetical protein